MKHVLVALMGLGAICEATALHRAPSNSRVMARQNFGKGKGGGKGNGGNRGKGNGGGKNNNNQGKNNNNNQGKNNNNNNGGNNGGNGASNTCLAANALQTASAATGQNGGDVTAGQVNSKT